MSTKKSCRIDEVRIHEDGRLLVVPDPAKSPDYQWIYRAALEVTWDADLASLATPPPRTGSYCDRFEFVLRASKEEYGVALFLDEQTRWVDVSDGDRAEFEARAASAV